MTIIGVEGFKFKKAINFHPNEQSEGLGKQKFAYRDVDIVVFRLVPCFVVVVIIIV